MNMAPYVSSIMVEAAIAGGIEWVCISIPSSTYLSIGDDTGVKFDEAPVQPI